MRITSSAFEHDGMIPVRHTCDGSGVSPPLTIEDLPDGVASLALVVEDPEAPSGVFDHWVAYDIPPLKEIPEGVDSLGVAGVNSTGRKGYSPPCPPSGVHHYHVRLFGLDQSLALTEGATKRQLLAAMSGHIVDEAALTGRYGR